MEIRDLDWNLGKNTAKEVKMRYLGLDSEETQAAQEMKIRFLQLEDLGDMQFAPVQQGIDLRLQFPGLITFTQYYQLVKSGQAFVVSDEDGIIRIALKGTNTVIEIAYY